MTRHRSWLLSTTSWLAIGEAASRHPSISTAESSVFWLKSRVPDSWRTAAAHG